MKLAQPEIPTDELYKFKTVLGLIIIVFSASAILWGASHLDTVAMEVRVASIELSVTDESGTQDSSKKERDARINDLKTTKLLRLSSFVGWVYLFGLLFLGFVGAYLLKSGFKEWEDVQSDRNKYLKEQLKSSTPNERQ